MKMLMSSPSFPALVAVAAICIAAYLLFVLCACKRMRSNTLEEARSLLDAVRRHVPDWQACASRLVRDVKDGEYTWADIGASPADIEMFDGMAS